MRGASRRHDSGQKGAGGQTVKWYIQYHEEASPIPTIFPHPFLKILRDGIQTWLDSQEWDGYTFEFDHDEIPF